ncbi:unnamed protein product [Aureobasidium mustum]|uniref:Uncharacterized protein n=1 Tax=Aureobasidium mustum TaxID=2773714 RepID=A0A9N8K355_9PEZI|nr:unnamed protein product [Aureobasidium mustum]
MPTTFQTLMIVIFAICASHLITGYFKSLVATAVLFLYLAALFFLVVGIVSFQWHTINFNHRAQFARLVAETERMNRDDDHSRSFCMAQEKFSHDYARRSERLWQEEQRRNLEEFRRHHQQTSSTSAMQAAFTSWRQDCRTLLQTPELITDMPRLPCLPCLPCPKGHCDSRPTHIGVCSHRLKKLYETSKLEEKELKDELGLWHPNGAKVNQVGAGGRKQILEMANEIAHVLQEVLEDL